MARVNIIIFIFIIIIFNLIVGCSAIRANNPAGVDTHKIALSNRLGISDFRKLDLSKNEKSDPYKGLYKDLSEDLYLNIPDPMTPYDKLRNSVDNFRLKLYANAANFDKSEFEPMFKGFAFYFRDDDHYSKNCVYVALKHDVEHLRKVKQIITRLMSTGGDDYKDIALSLLTFLLNLGIYAVDVLEDNGEILSDANLNILQQKNDLKVINSVQTDLNSLFQEQESIFNAFIVKLKYIVNLKEIDAVKDALKLVIDKKGEIFRRVDDGTTGLLGLKEKIKNIIGDLKRQREIQAIIDAKLKKDLEEQQAKQEKEKKKK
ncbi:hypothetical protein [Borrelia persica]|uniref:hypothetical protein n=1 Tax=Borrelia persica TaxID=44448 RepID=UPI0004670A0B|nr:hypothetical protein [Borrelia persica]